MDHIVLGLDLRLEVLVLRFSELRPIYHGHRAPTFALARLSCTLSNGIELMR